MDPEARKKIGVAAIGLAAFFAAGPVSRYLRRNFPQHPFASQVLVGGSLAVVVYSIAKTLAPESRAPEAMLSRSWGVFGGAYQGMKNAQEDFPSV
jgi:hypothetical protein